MALRTWIDTKHTVMFEDETTKRKYRCRPFGRFNEALECTQKIKKSSKIPFDAVQI